MSDAIKREEILHVWENFRNGKIAPGSGESLSQQLKSDTKTTSDYLTVMQKIAKEYDFEDFANFVEKNELPALKLSRSEMETLKGGTIPVWDLLKAVIKGTKFFT
jgi:hypothetical protein